MYRWEQRTLLCFAPILYTVSFPLSIVFLNFLFIFSFFSKRMTYDIHVYGKHAQKKTEKRGKILNCMLLHKNFRGFSSYLMIYKTTFLLYNIICRWARAYRVPLFCTLQFCFYEMSSLWHPCVRAVTVCNFYFYQKSARNCLLLDKIGIL